MTSQKQNLLSKIFKTTIWILKLRLKVKQYEWGRAKKQMIFLALNSEDLKICILFLTGNEKNVDWRRLLRMENRFSTILGEKIKTCL